MTTLRTRLEKSCFAPRLKARNKREALEELSDLLVEGGLVATEARDDVLAALIDREEKMSTGMQYGVAIPHAKTDRISELISAVAISEEGVDFDSLDDKPAFIFVVTLSPPTEVGSHIRFLADVSRQLGSQRVREQVIRAETAEEMVTAFCDDALPE